MGKKQLQRHTIEPRRGIIAQKANCAQQWRWLDWGSGGTISLLIFPPLDRGDDSDAISSSVELRVTRNTALPLKKRINFTMIWFHTPFYNATRNEHNKNTDTIDKLLCCIPLSTHLDLHRQGKRVQSSAKHPFPNKNSGSQAGDINTRLTEKNIHLITAKRTSFDSLTQPTLWIFLSRLPWSPCSFGSMMRLFQFQLSMLLPSDFVTSYSTYSYSSSRNTMLVRVVSYPQTHLDFFYYHQLLKQID